MNVTPSQVLTWGIVAAATCWTGILGIVFGCIGRNKAQAYVAAYGMTTGQVKTGSILSKVGLIVGIVMTVIWAIYITVAIIAAIALL